MKEIYVIHRGIALAIIHERKGGDYDEVVISSPAKSLTCRKFADHSVVIDETDGREISANTAEAYSKLTEVLRLSGYYKHSNNDHSVQRHLQSLISRPRRELAFFLDERFKLVRQVPKRRWSKAA